MAHDAEIPVDPDVIKNGPSGNLSIGNIALVVLGGTLGSLARGWIAEALSSHGADIATVIVNVSGAFFLGFVISFLAVSDKHSSTRWKLVLGTGVAGGFTTYSAFAFTFVDYILDGQLWYLLVFGLGTVLVGGAVCYLGIVLGTRVGKGTT